LTAAVPTHPDKEEALQTSRDVDTVDNDDRCTSETIKALIYM